MTPYHFKLLHDISTLQRKVKEKDSKIAELLNEIKELRRESDEELRREPREKLGKSKSYDDGKKKESNYS